MSVKLLFRKIIGRINTILHFKENKQIEKKRFAFYSQLISPDDLVFDVGANIGNRVKIFLQLGAKVVAIEPQKKCYTHLKQKFGKKIIIVPKGAGERKEQKLFYVSDVSVLSTFSEEFITSTQNSGRFKQYKWQKPHYIDVTTLDALIQEYGIPRFIKIDVEGYELEVLKGLSHVINCISIEYCVPEQTKKTIDCLKQIGCIAEDKIRFNYSIGESMEFALQEWLPIDEMIVHVCSQDFEQTGFGDIYAHKID